MFKLDDFIAQCQAALKEHSPQLAIKEVIQRAVSCPGEIKSALGTPTRAEIGTLYRADDLTILNVIWAPGMTIYPHDHRVWAVIGIYAGRENNTFYRRTSKGIVQAGGKQLDAQDSSILGDAVIHAVANPLGSFTGAIHVYGGDFFTIARSEFNPQTLEEQPYSVERTKQIFLEANKHTRVADKTESRVRSVQINI